MKTNKPKACAVCFEIPSNTPKEIDSIKSLAESCRADIKFVVAANNCKYDDYTSSQILIRHVGDCDYNKVSMFKLRSEASRIADEFNPSARVLADSNFVFRGAWQEFIVETFELASRVSAETSRPFYLGMAGSLGSNYAKRAIHIPVNPMFETSKGIMYSDSLKRTLSNYEHLLASLEDWVFCAHALLKENAIPLKRFLGPIQHKITKVKTATTFIHNRQAWEENGLQTLRELWKDPLWTMPLTFGHRGRDAATGRYHEKQPKRSYNFMAALRGEFLADDSLRRLVFENGLDRSFARKQTNKNKP